MGEKKKIKFWDYSCKGANCGKKFLMSKLEEDGYVDHIKVGRVVFCPLCGNQELIQE